MKGVANVGVDVEISNPVRVAVWRSPKLAEISLRSTLYYYVPEQVPGLPGKQ